MSSVPGTDLEPFRSRIRGLAREDESRLLCRLILDASLDPGERRRISAAAAALVREVRDAGRHPMLESFLTQYSLSTAEGVGLMCLAEALLRVPDARTIDDLIRDKIEPSDWSAHLGRSSSPMINASTWALMLTGRLLDDDALEGPAGALRGLIRRLGEPVVRIAVAQAMKALGQQFVLGQTIDEALQRGRPMREQGCTYSYDMLGEAARTAGDAQRYEQAYAGALHSLAPSCGADLHGNPAISVKLSALHPRYEYVQRARVMTELVPRAIGLARLAREANMGFTIDAEEADRLDLSLDVIESVLSDPGLSGWDGFGVVVQAYGLRASAVLDWLYALAGSLDRRLTVRLVKGAYWDSEIKRAQELGLAGFPVFTRKAHTDASYLACAQKLLTMTDRIYPQFATHNAHTCAAVLGMSNGRDRFEFQRLHGMGEALHRIIRTGSGTRCRIYAPVGAHRDLLAYLVRRLLENGANSSFVNQIADERIEPEVIARDPLEAIASAGLTRNATIIHPSAVFAPARRAARGWNLEDPTDLQALLEAREFFRARRWRAAPLLSEVPGMAATAAELDETAIRNPADPADIVGWVAAATPTQVAAALRDAVGGFDEWTMRPVGQRADILRKAATSFEENAAEFFALCAREAGKTLKDAVAELREAVDFLNYYASEAERLDPETVGTGGRGVFICISPWNFPLAIFTGQVAAALAAGNAVIAKPAQQTPLIAARAISLLREAGVPAAALQMIPGDGPATGGALVASPGIAGVLFTGSIQAAQSINRALAASAAPDAVLVAETGGLNAMVVDSTALPEQAVRDILASAFQSAGQRCSALRVLYIQRDVSERMLEMLYGAMDELALGDPWLASTDIGPVIDEAARQDIQEYSDRMAGEGRLLKRLSLPRAGRFVAPQVLRVDGIGEVEREVFGPVLHVATFEAQELDQVVQDINRRGYGLTFGLHTRIDDRVQRVVERIQAGNIYVNRNQIGAVVGSQPFGGEGLSGTGPKAGGPHYVSRLMRQPDPAGVIAPASASTDEPVDRRVLSGADFKAALTGSRHHFYAIGWAERTDRLEVLKGALAGLAFPAADAVLAAARHWSGEPVALPGPTGETNRLRLVPRGRALCLGPGWRQALVQALQSLSMGGSALLVADDIAAGDFSKVLRTWQAQGVPVAWIDAGSMPADLSWLEHLEPLGLVAYATAAGTTLRATALRQALARRHGEIKPLVTEIRAPQRYVLERLLCVDTTAAGGNATLLAASA